MGITMIKTKIVATLGPASDRGETIKALIDNGTDVFRLNFSHGSLDKHAALLETINGIRTQHRHAIAVMGDLCGPKIRTGGIDPEGQILNSGDELVIQPGLEMGTATHFGTNYPYLARDVEIGHRVLIDDGQISLKVTDKKKEQIICHVLVGGPLHSHKGINLPDSKVSAASITERDWQCVEWAVEHQLDYLAMSFVRTAEEIDQLKSYLRKAGSPVKVVSKIEKPEALDNLESIIQASDAVLVARGDLGVEMDLAQVPLYQKRITQLCRRLGKPVIVATQMLQSMIDAPVPTRAEVSDVANAIIDFTDAVMLSGESAVGKYPIEAVRTIVRIARVTEAFMDESDVPRPKIETDNELAVTASVSRSVAQLIDELDARLVVAWSQNGSTARILSKARIDVPIIAFSSDELACRQMSMNYGVTPICRPIPADIREFADMVDKTIIENNWAKVADQIILLPGRPLTRPAPDYAMMIHTIDSD